MSGNKVKSLLALKREIVRLKSLGKRIVFTNGCYDILHYGHVRYLEDAHTKGDILIVAVNSDASIRRLKGKDRPIVNERDRALTIAGLGCVDFVVLFSDDTPLALIKTLMPDVLVKGADWNKKNIVGADVVMAHGGKVETIRLEHGRSTTHIIEKIAKLFAK